MQPFPASPSTSSRSYQRSSTWSMISTSGHLQIRRAQLRPSVSPMILVPTAPLCTTQLPRGSSTLHGEVVHVHHPTRDSPATHLHPICHLESNPSPPPLHPAVDVGAWTAVGAEKRAHVAAGAIHITSNRTENVHFTLPYYVAGYVVVVKAPQQVAHCAPAHRSNQSLDCG